MGERDDKEPVFRSGQEWAPGWARISLSHRLPCPPCRGVRPDREQEVRGDSSRPVADNVSVPINTGHAVARAQPHSRSGGEVAAGIVGSSSLQCSVYFCLGALTHRLRYQGWNGWMKKGEALVYPSRWCGQDTSLLPICTTASSMRKGEEKKVWVYLEEPKTWTDFLVLLLKFSRMQIVYFLVLLALL